MLQKIIMFFLNLIFPIRCLGGCGQYDIWLCNKCQLKIDTNIPPECPACRKKQTKISTCPACSNKTHLNGLVVLADYDHPIIQEMIQLMKYQYIEGLCINLGRLLGNKLQVEKSQYSDNTIVVPVPLHRRRKNERGFNQSELIAKQVAQTLDFSLKPTILKRHRYTAPQAKLQKKDRLTNLTDSFRYNSKLVLSGQNVILIDDVATTTTTLNECARMLKSSGAGEVVGAVIARSHK